jgi:hypothetical protein
MGITRRHDLFSFLELVNEAWQLLVPGRDDRFANGHLEFIWIIWPHIRFLIEMYERTTNFSNIPKGQPYWQKSVWP